MRQGPHPFDHNQFVAIESRDDLPPGLPAMHFFKCDIEALHKAVMKMPLELGGFYVRALLAMYREMSPLPADDQQARAMLGVDVRTYRRLKRDLLEIPGCLIEKPSGRISNNRFEEEITAYVIEYRNRQRAARAREEKKRAAETTQTTEPANFQPTSAELPANFEPTSAELPADLRPISVELPPELTDDLSKKRNEINGGNSTTLPQPDHSSGTTDGLRARVLESRTRVRVIKKEEEEEGRGEESPHSAGALARGADLIEAPVIRWRAGDDGSFSGRVVGYVPPCDMASFRAAYPALEFPAALIEAENLIRDDAERLNADPGSPALVRRVTAFLGKKQSEFAELRSLTVAKAVSDSEECRWDGARIVVAGPLRDELLQLVDGCETRMQDTLDKAAISIGIELRGQALVKATRGWFKRLLRWENIDDQKVLAIERRASGNVKPSLSPDGKTMETRAQRLARMAGEAMEKMETRK